MRPYDAICHAHVLGAKKIGYFECNRRKHLYCNVSCFIHSSATVDTDVFATFEGMQSQLAKDFILNIRKGRTSHGD